MPNVCQTWKSRGLRNRDAALPAASGRSRHLGTRWPSKIIAARGLGSPITRRIGCRRFERRKVGPPREERHLSKHERQARIDPAWIPIIDTGRAWKVYLALSAYANGEREAWPRLAKLAEDTGLNERDVRRELRTLELGGALLTFPGCGKGGTSLYVLQPSPESYSEKKMTTESGPGGFFGSTFYTIFKCLYEDFGVTLYPRLLRRGESLPAIDRMNVHNLQDGVERKPLTLPTVTLEPKYHRGVPTVANHQGSDEEAISPKTYVETLIGSAMVLVARQAMPWSMVAYLTWHVARDANVEYGATDDLAIAG